MFLSQLPSLEITYIPNTDIILLSHYPNSQSHEDSSHFGGIFSDL